MIRDQSLEGVVDAPTEILVSMTSKNQEAMEIEQCDSSTSEISDVNDDEETSAIAATPCLHKGSRKSVSFSTLQIREYGIIPGDNPSVVFGCPLSIGWEYEGETTCSVEDYEAVKPEPRTMIELRIPSMLREEKLKRVGFSRRDIQEGAKLATIVRNQRKRTEETLNLAPLQEFIERAKRSTINLVHLGKKRKERDLMKCASGGAVAGKTLLRRDYSMRGSIETAPMDVSLFSLHSS